ncbi:MAG: DUF4388 domain-containing protein [candidate division Zixibacteria bacterium]|nr:DUF4388 domain-containing protein [candidate division Zixibacteria bacterium]
MDQALQGKIGRFTLPEIFQLVANSRETGTLGIQRDDDIVMVYFKEGRIIYAYGPRQTYHLGQLLRERGRITTSQLDDAVKTQSRQETSKRLGKILIEKKYIDRADLQEVVQTQIEELIYSLLSWESGTFKFYDRQYPTQEEITISLSVENVILEGLRRLDEMNRIREALPDFSKVLEIAPTQQERTKDISLQAHEWNLLALVNGQRTIGEIAEMAEMPKMDALAKLAALKLAGLVSVANRTVDHSDRLAAMVDRVSGLLEEYLVRKAQTRENDHTTTEIIGENQ